MSSVHKHTIELIAIDDLFIVANKARNFAKILTKSQYELLLPLLNTFAAPLKEREPRHDDGVTDGMAHLLAVMADYQDQISIKEIVSLSNSPLGTVHNMLFKLKNLKLVYPTDRGVYKITQKGTAYARRRQPNGTTEHAAAGTANPPG